MKFRSMARYTMFALYLIFTTMASAQDKDVRTTEELTEILRADDYYII